MKDVLLFLAAASAATIPEVLSAEPYKMTFYLTAHWLENGQQFCKYSNGTILNVGYNYCPWSIRV